MSANDLFSFLDATDDNDDIVIEDATKIEQQQPQENGRPLTPTSTLKRKAESPESTTRPPDQNGDTNMEDIAQPDGNGPTKKPRMGSPKPVVLDDFETEAKREVAASAGLTGATTEAGSRLELRHQVMRRLSRLCNPQLGVYLDASGPTSSCSAARV